MNRQIAFLLLTILLCGRVFASRTELVYDGNLVQRTSLETHGGTEFISLKSVAALFKGKTQWLPIAGKVVLQLNNRKISFSADTKTVAVGNNKYILSARPRLVKGTLLVPLDFFLTSTFAEIADCRIKWDQSSSMLTAEPKVTMFSPRIYSRSHSTKIVVETLEDANPDLKRKGKILTIDIPKVRIAGEETVKVNDKVVGAVSVLRGRKGAQIKVSLADKVTYYNLLQEKNPPRIVLRIQNPNPPDPEEDEYPVLIPREVKEAVPREDVSEESKSSAPLSAEPPAKKKAEKSVWKNSGNDFSSERRVKRIVVDAGHGGQDPGAIGRTGTKEKDINLLIALELARMLKIDGGYEVLLTRSSDTFIPLIDRSMFANDNKADLFISIHCNASISRSQGGFEVYFLAENASDEHAEAAEQLENSVIALEGPVSPQKQKLQELLFSMARNEFINEASLLCNSITRSVKKRVAIENRGIKQANFHVLHGVQMPSVLVESAFLTKASEEAKLRQKKFRSALVDSILTAVQDYEKKLQRLEGNGRKG